MKNYEDFAKKWIAAWNNHDVDAILSHYAENLEFHSPFVSLLDFNNEGIIRSKEELRKYFTIGLHTYPDLNFKLEKVLSGVHSVVIYYESVSNKMAAEVFFLNDFEQAEKIYCHYAQNN